MTLAVRPDLSNRTGLSKSALTEFEMCGWKAWHAIHHRRPLIPNERVAFGRALDLGVETLITQKRAGQEVDLAAAFASAAMEAEQSEVPIVFSEIEDALRSFPEAVLPFFDWTHAALQKHITYPDREWGTIDLHPDILLGDGEGRFPTVLDVKSAKRSKTEADVRNSLELGIYAIGVEEETGQWPSTVGYLTYVRSAKPGWQTLTLPLTDGMVRRALEQTATYVRARRADELWNTGAETIENVAFTGGPRFRGLCGDCQYADICPVREEGGTSDAV